MARGNKEDADRQSNSRNVWRKNHEKSDKKSAGSSVASRGRPQLDLGDLEQCAEESDLETLRDNIEDAAGILHDCSQEIFDLEMFLYQKVRGIDLPRSCKELDEANAG